ncbi:MAG: BCCT family transporter [[Clostridium] symbiosum]
MTTDFGWLYLLAMIVFLVFVLYVAFGRYGKIRLEEMTPGRNIVT